MSKAICFKCGSEKFGALSDCASCGVSPRTDHQVAISLVLCEHLSTEVQLERYAYQIHQGRQPDIQGSTLAKAWEALQDKQLMAMLGRKISVDPSHRDPAPQVSSIKSSPRKTAFYTEPTLLHNAFQLLGATVRDDRRRIVELAEEKSLELDHEDCQKARSDLTSPRTRLSFEMGWLPGVSPRKASQLINQLCYDPMSIRTETGIPSLAHANLMSAAFEAVGADDDLDDISEFIQEMAYLVDEISVEDIIRDVNEDRAVSGFPEVRTYAQVEAVLAELKRGYKNAIKDALNRFSPESLVEIMTLVVDSATIGGEDHAPELIDELVDSYTVESIGFLQKESENIHKLIKVTRDAAHSGESAVKPLVDKLEVVARNWDRVAQPIQLSAKARGIQHDHSNEIAYAIRCLAVDLFNEHDLLNQSKRITALLQELFAEVPEVAERIEQDADTLQEIFQNRKQAEVSRNEWAREITYSAEIGLVFKDTLSISPQGVVWKDQRYSLESITRVRWGGVRHSVNGIPTGTTYTLAFGDNRSEAVVGLKREDVFSTFVDKLWRAVCVRLLIGILESLKSGNEVRFGSGILRDDGVTLTKHKFIGSNEYVRCNWSQVSVWSSAGSFVIGHKEDNKTYASMSYIDTPNTHIYEQAIRMGFKKPGMRRLSELLADD